MARRLWVLGDSWTAPHAVGAARVWPRLVAQRLGLGLVGSGVAGTGYLASEPTFPEQAYRGTGAGADAVIVWGSINDVYVATPEQVYDAAADTYAILRDACPDAPILVFGPQYWFSTPPDYLIRYVEAVRDAAADAGASFHDVSLLMQGRPDLIDYPDGQHPGPVGHRRIADLIAPELLFALPSRPATVGDPGGGREYADGQRGYADGCRGSAATLPSPSIGCLT